MATPPDESVGSLEHAREHLYAPGSTGEPHTHPLLADAAKKILPHRWGDSGAAGSTSGFGWWHLRLARAFFMVAATFFLVSAGIAGYIFLAGSNSVSMDKISVEVLGSTTTAGGDIVSFSLVITNRNTVAIERAVLEVDFPNGTRSADDILQDYPRYLEELGTLESGERVTRTVRAVVFGGAGQTLSLPITLFYGATGSNATFIKNASYTLAVLTTPLSVSIDTLSETVSGEPLTLTLSVSSNATIPLDNVVLAGTFPFGFEITASSLPIRNGTFLLGILKPGDRRIVTVTGTLTGQDSEERVFHFTVGTAKTAQDETLSIPYMTQDAAVTIAAPFINTTLAINGDTSSTVVLAPDASHTVSISYTNTLSTSITDAKIIVAISGAPVDYKSIKSGNGFYSSADRTVVFSKDSDSTLALLAPDAFGVGTLTFKTLPTSAAVSAPTVTFTTSVSGTRVGQANVPRQISASATKTARVATSVVLSALSLHTSGPIGNSGPIPPKIDERTTYTVVWDVQNKGNTIAGGIVSATLPSYITYTGLTAGSGSFSYNDASHTVSWNTGDLVQGAGARGYFQVALTPSISQRGTEPPLTRSVSFSGYDRFASVQVSATAEPATTETKGDPDLLLGNGSVQ